MDKIGKYRVVRPLGRGGMGEVYLAEDPDIGRRVAIKVLLPESDEEARRRFTHEARTVGRLSHPHIVTLLEYGFHGEQPYLVLEYLEGTSLDRWLDGDPPLEARLRVLQELAQAVDYSHRHEVLHRDIKPTNLQILGDGHLKLLDFGIARSRAERLTATGLLVGTPEYMAPEVLRDGDHSARSDVYAVGLVAYEVLTGVQPFRAQRLEACLHKILMETPAPLGVLLPGVPPGLSDAVMACLRKDPQERPETLVLLEAELERARGGPVSTTQATIRLPSAADAPTQPAARPPSRRHPAVSAVVALVVLALAALAAYWALVPRELLPVPAPGEPGMTEPAPEMAEISVPEAAEVDSAGTEDRPTDRSTDRPTDTSASTKENPLQTTPPATPRAAPPTPAPVPQPKPQGPVERQADEPATIQPDSTPITTASPLVLLSDAAAESRREDLDRQEPVGASEAPAISHPVLTDVSPRSVRRGDSVSLHLGGHHLDAIERIEVRRAGRPARGFRILRLHHESGQLVVQVQVGREVSLGAYTVHVAPAEGAEAEADAWSEGITMEVSL